MATRREAKPKASKVPPAKKAKTPPPKKATKATPEAPAMVVRSTKSKAKNLPREACPAATGRPLVEVNERQLETLAQIGCTYAEMAAVMGVHPDTLADRFSEQIETWRQGGKASLRKRQWGAALSGDRTMLIWLGKQELGQRDFKSIENTGPNGGPIEISSLTAEERERRILALVTKAEQR